MIFLKKLCRINGNTNRQTRERNQEQEQHHHQQQQQLQINGILPRVSGNSVPAAGRQVVNSLNRTTRQRYREDNGSSNNNTNVQFVNRPFLCRTPPPNYNALPATPPPLYTPRQSKILNATNAADAADAVGALQVPEVLSLNRHVSREVRGRRVVAENSVEVVGQQQQQGQAHVECRRQLEPTQRLDNVASPRNVRSATAAARSLSAEQQRRQNQILQQQFQQNQYQNHQNQHQQEEQHQQLRRRRRLQLLQQHHQIPHINIANTESSSSTTESESSPASDLRRRFTRRPHGVRDAYCPDLLHACSLILYPAQQSSDSSVGSFTDSQTIPALSSSDYVEIDDVRLVESQQHNQRQQRVRNAFASFNNHALQQAKSTPELRARNVRNVASLERNAGSHIYNGFTSLDGIENQKKVESGEMGQNLSLRRPRISLTWVLRDQQQQQQQQQESQDAAIEKNENESQTPTTEKQNNNIANGHEVKQRSEVVPTNLDMPSTTKRYRLKQLPGSTEPLNGYATTPTANMASMLPQKFFSNQNLLDYKEKAQRTPSRELLFVCTPQRLPRPLGDKNEALVLVKKRNEIRKRLAAKVASLQQKSMAINRAGDGAEARPNVITPTLRPPVLTNGVVEEKDELKSLKGTYSEPSLIAVSEGNPRRHRHRKRRDRNRVQKFGYEINNVDEFLSKCSLTSPGNIPVVLSTASTLYQTRPGGYQTEIPLPLGMVVNAVFKNENWLYVQTPHAEEGYVGYACCLPLGILPPTVSGKKPTPCWESNGDIFPRPCGNMTDSEKEIRLRSGTRSDGARTPRGKRETKGIDNGTDTADTKNGNSVYAEHHVDKLYLRAASQPKLVEKAYAQLRATKNATTSVHSSNDEYVTLQQQQKSKLHVQKHLQQQQEQLRQLQQKPLTNGPFITNGHNGQHFHPKVASSNSNSNSNSNSIPNPNLTNGRLTPLVNNPSLRQTMLSAVRKQQCTGLRQTLVAINTNYTTESISLQRGEIVTLCECRETKDHKQWFYVRTRDGREGYIPAEVAGHGYL